MLQVLRHELDRAFTTRTDDSLEASVAMRSKMSLTKEFKIAMALLEIPVSGCTCFSTIIIQKLELFYPKALIIHTFVDVG
jgi:hypothetical protein